MPEFEFSPPTEAFPLVAALKQFNLTASTSEAYRMIEQGGVRVNGDKISDKAIMLRRGQTYILQVGKRKFARISLK
jgi:tyrosyl-tRNA synthetase